MYKVTFLYNDLDLMINIFLVQRYCRGFVCSCLNVCIGLLLFTNCSWKWNGGNIKFIYLHMVCQLIECEWLLFPLLHVDSVKPLESYIFSIYSTHKPTNEMMGIEQLKFFIGKELVRKNVTWLLRYGLNKFLIHINIPNFIFNHLNKSDMFWFL